MKILFLQFLGIFPYRLLIVEGKSILYKHNLYSYSCRSMGYHRLRYDWGPFPTMIRLFRRLYLGHLPCRCSYILLFSIIAVVSLVVLIQSTFAPQSILPKSVETSIVLSHNRKGDTRARCSEPNCLTQQECNIQKVIFI